MKKSVYTDPRWVFASISLFISIIIYSQAEITNTDGVLYLRVADTFISNGFDAAKKLYSNPYYSIFIALTAKLTGLTTFISAQAINALTCAAIAWFMVDIARLTSQSSYSPWIAGLLFTLYPQFNEYRDYIIRDFLFWAFTIAFMSCYLRFLLSLSSRFLMVGIMLLALGSMFRTEAILFTLLPLICLIPLKKHIMVVKTTINFYRWLLLTIPIIIILYWLNPSIFDSTTYYIDKLSAFGESYSRLATNFEDYLLNGYLTKYSGAAVLCSFLIILVLKVLKSFTASYILLAALSLGSSRDSRFSRLRVAPLLTAVLFYFFLVYIFLLSTTIIQGRHVLLLSLFLIPILSGWVESFGIVLNSRRKGRKKMILITAIACVYLFTDSFFTFGHSKQYLTDSVLWLQDQSSQCKLLSNNSRISYFSHMNAQTIRLDDVKFNQIKFLNMAGHSKLIVLEVNERNPFHTLVMDTLDATMRRSISFGATHKRAIIWSNPNSAASCNSEDQK